MTRSLRAFACLLLILGAGNSTVAGQEKKSSGPTPEQLKEVEDALDKLGGELYGPHPRVVGAHRVIAWKFTDADLAKLPKIPFPFYILLGDKVTDAGLKELRKHPTLAGITLRRAKVTATGLKELAEIPIEEAILLAPNVTDDDLVPVGKFAKLRWLDVAGTKVTDAGLEHLAGLKLKSLKIPTVARTERGLKHFLAALDAPQQLDLSFWSLDDASVKLLAGHKQLEVLNLSKTKVTDAGLKELAGLESLRELYLLGTGVTDDGLKSLVSLQGLKVLNLVDTAVTDAGVKLLAGRKLTSLALPEAAKTDLGLKNMLDACVCPESLDLQSWKVTDKGMESLAPLADLKRLDLRLKPITDAGVRNLAGLKKLEWLHLGGVEKLTDTGVKHLAGMTEMRCLNLSFCPKVTDAALADIGQLKKLYDLNLVRTGVTAKGATNLSGVLKDVRVTTDCSPIEKHRP
jgi:internalin A